MKNQTIKRYSVCFKRQVVEDLEDGRFDTIQAARDHYGIGGSATIPNWLRQYGKNHLLPKVVIVQKSDEKDQIRALKRQVLQLQYALGETQTQNVLHAEFLKMACDELGCDIESFKKRAVPRGSSSGRAPGNKRWVFVPGSGDDASELLQSA